MKFALSRSLIPLLLLFSLSILVSACTPSGSTGRGFAYIWYVATSGDDANTCSHPAEPCATLSGVFNKARAENTRLEAEYPDLTVVDHTVNVAAGTYMVTGIRPGYPFATANINVAIVGAGQSTTIFDGADTYGGLSINGDANVRIRNLTFQNMNGNAPDSCINLRSTLEVRIENVTVQHCYKSGIAHLGPGSLTLVNVTSTANILDPGGNGLGVSSFGELVIEGGSFSSNEGSGIISGGTLHATGLVAENNQRDGLVLRGSAELVDVVLQNNGQDLSFRAGLMVDGGDVIVRTSQISNNQYGIQVVGGALRIFESEVSGNPRTGLLVEGGEVRLTETTVSDNGAFYYNTSLGGGIANEARLIIRNSYIEANGNGGIYNAPDGELFLIESRVTENLGGLPALFNQGSAIIERSLIANNTINDRNTTDAAVENRGSMVVLNSTISGNSHTGVTGVVGSLSLAYSTVVENGTYGLSAFNGADVVANVSNSIVAKNATADCAVSTGPGILPIPSAGVNMDSDASCGFPETYSSSAILLDGLADNGGPTWTHALLDGSPALEAATGSCPTNDQRNLARPFGPACDVGAYEGGATTLSLDTDDESLDLATVTPTAGGSGILIVIPGQTYNCRKGNSTAFDIADTLVAGQEYQPVGIGNDSLWFQFEGPTYGRLCWTPVSAFTLFLNGDEIELPDLPPGLLTVKVYPAPPPATSTPTPTDEPEPPQPTATCDPQQPQCP